MYTHIGRTIPMHEWRKSEINDEVNLTGSRPLTFSVRAWFMTRCDVMALLKCLTHWLPELFAKNAFLDILVVFGLDLGQISFNLVENAFATRQLALLATSVAFCDILAGACAEIKILDGKVTYVFRLFDFWIFFFCLSFFLLFFSFCRSDWPSSGLSCG